MAADKLYLRNKMTRTRLIQRLNKPVSHPNPFSFGGGLNNGGISKEWMDVLSKVLSFDYMGAAEFEWGAVPEAISFLVNGAGDLEEGELLINDKTVYFICPSQYREDLLGRLKALYEDEFDHKSNEVCLHTSSHFRKSLEEESEYHSRTVGWLEIDNGFMFFKDKDMFENMKVLLGIVIPGEGSNSFTRTLKH